MVEQHGGCNVWPPVEAPLLNVPKDDHWRQFDNSVNAVSFGFVATAILISMFLVMAIFERFFRPTSARTHGDLESQMGFNAKLSHPSPKMTVYANGVSVLMPGDNIPTFIAHPAPVPCLPDRKLLMNSHSNPISNATSSSISGREN
ncbi:uncharacterized protein LOC110604524 [Manihot esculenta]|uniref:Uncharacterized protein n=1 Tax=Manihot esculenta TaxID=3983 RepID=A0A2C9U5T7_MANES|nr:uncharacterized protein LOC110604524 [Manihot esculenta]OAY24758.1 hypothetical protein MANES_17G041300v8 [Manihot esculenta]